MFCHCINMPQLPLCFVQKNHTNPVPGALCCLQVFRNQTHMCDLKNPYFFTALRLTTLIWSETGVPEGSLLHDQVIKKTIKLKWRSDGETGRRVKKKWKREITQYRRPHVQCSETRREQVQWDRVWAARGQDLHEWTLFPMVSHDLKNTCWFTDYC